MALKYRKVIAAVYNTPWAIMPEKLADITTLMDLRSQGARLTREQIRDRVGPTRSPVTPPEGRVALLNMFGTITQRANFFSEFSGGTSTEQFARAFREAVDSDQVSAIIINIDSPGGAVPGVQELSDLIFESRGKKPIIAVANPMMASAAYWIGSAADEIVAIPSAVAIGSIGVLTVHHESSARDAKMGSKFTIVKSTEFKAEGNPYEPLSEAAKEYMEERVMKIHASFVESVARNRGVAVSRVEADYGRGRTFLAQDALAAGLVDRIATLEEVLRDLGAGAAPTKQNSGFGARHQEKKMDPKLMTLLVRLGACEADETQANAFVDTFYERYKGDKSQRPKEESKILGDIEIASKAFSAEEFVRYVATGKANTLPVNPPTVPPANQPPAASTPSHDVSEILAAVNLATAIPAETRLSLQGELVSQYQAGTITWPQVLDRINREAVASNPPAGPTNVRTTESERDKFHVQARDAILLRRNQIGTPDQIFDSRTGQNVDWRPERGNHGLANLLSLAQQCLVMSGTMNWQQVHNLTPFQVGQLVMGADPRQIGIYGFVASDGPAYNVSGMFSNILLDAANVSLRRSFDDSRTTFQMWARRGEDIRDFKPVHRVIAGEFSDPKVIPEDGEFEEVTLTDGKESYKLVVWGEVFSHSWQLVVNDQLGSFMEAPEKMGRAMRRKMNRLVYQVLKDNAALASGTALFDDATHNNLTTGALTTSSDYVTAWNTMQRKMQEQRGLDADSAILNLMPRWIIYPPALRGIIRQTLGSPSVAINTAGNENTVNIWQQGLEPVEEGELGSTTPGGSDTAFYHACDTSDIDTIEYAYLQGMASPVVEQAVAFDRLAMRRRIYFAFGQKALDFRGLQKHTGAA